MNEWRDNKGRLLIPVALLAVLIILAACHSATAPGSPTPQVSVYAVPAASPTTTATPTPTVPPTAPAMAVLTTCPTPTAASASPTPATTKAPATPEPVPLPSASQEPSVEEVSLSCTLSISCADLLERLDELDEGKRELVPSDGWLLAPTQVEFEAGESVFDVLQRTCRDQGLHMEFSSTPLYPSAYIEGIGNLYEFDCGPLSGWNYVVNGQQPNYSCSEYTLEQGDVIVWQYSV